MTKSEFVEWKESRTTKEVFEILKETKNAYLNQLVASTGQPEALRVAGAIEAFDYLLNIEWEGE